MKKLIKIVEKTFKFVYNKQQSFKIIMESWLSGRKRRS